MRSRARIGSHPIHPMLVGLPIGMWVASWIFDLLSAWFNNPSLGDTGYFLAIAGCIGAVLAAIPGVIDWTTAIPPDSSGKITGALHGFLNIAVLALFIVIAIERRGLPHNPSSLTLILSTIGIALLGVSGWLGGTLSYELQVGVFHRQTQARPLVERTIAGFNYPVCHQSELADGQMILIHNRGPEDRERIVVGKIAEGYFAFSDHCPHKGGPLCDGALAGSTVQCPWHGSEFDIRTGRVVAGPASKPIKVFDIRVREGEVYLISPPVASYSQKRAS